MRVGVVVVVVVGGGGGGGGGGGAVVRLVFATLHHPLHRLNAIRHLAAQSVELCCRDSVSVGW
jgi:hypothetical protein